MSRKYKKWKQQKEKKKRYEKQQARTELNQQVIISKRAATELIENTFCQGKGRRTQNLKRKVKKKTLNKKGNKVTYKQENSNMTKIETTH